MYHCRRAVLEQIQSYKSMLAQYVTPAQWRLCVDRLMIARLQLRQLSDLALYERACAVLMDIESMLGGSVKTASWHSGIDGFYEHFKQFLSAVTVYEKHLVHGPQKASCALVHAIQILCLPTEACSAVLTGRLYQHGAVIATLGNHEVQQAYLSVLAASHVKDHLLVRPLLADYKQRL